MPEREVAKYQSISRMTVNKVVKKLVNEGFLDRIQGKGTFVAYKKEVHKFQNLKGFTEVMNEKGVKVKNEILSFEILEPSEKILSKLQIKNELVYKIERLRIIDNTPFAFETVYIPKKVCKDLSYEKLKDNSLYSLLEGRYNQEIKNANQIINPVLLNKKEAKILNRNINLPSLRFDRVAFNQNDEAIEYTISYILSDGTNNVANASTYTIETDTFSLQDASKTSCLFEGWFDTATFDPKVTKIVEGSMGDKTLYAKYSLNATIANTLNAGTYLSAQEFELSCTLSGATIYYNMDYGTGVGSDLIYNKDVYYYISKDCTLTAWAEMNGEISGISTYVYTCTNSFESSVSGLESSDPIIKGNAESISANFDIIQIPNITTTEQDSLENDIPAGYDYAEVFHLNATVNGEIVENHEFNGYVTVNLNNELESTK